MEQKLLRKKIRVTFLREKEAFNAEGFIKVNFPQNHQVFLKENLIDSTEMLE